MEEKMEFTEMILVDKNLMMKTIYEAADRCNVKRSSAIKLIFNLLLEEYGMCLNEEMANGAC